MNSNRKNRRTTINGLSPSSLIILLAAALLFTACANPFRAASMKLMKAEGTVNILDQKGKDIAPKDEMNLYSGYQVSTRKTSYAWIDLDRERLAKLDAKSEAQINKSGNKLEITVNSGNLFFNIATPLEDNESLDIRTSSMMVGIRGTCGWVEVIDDERMLVYLLEGKVKCTVTDPDSSSTFSASVSAGEKAELVLLDDGPDILVEDLTYEDIPDFVMEELEDDDDLCERILDDSGLDIQNPDNHAPSGDDSSSADDGETSSEIPDSVVFYGDRSRCRITPEIAGAYASVIRNSMASLDEYYNTFTHDPYIAAETENMSPPIGYAALFDSGNGIPALFFSGGSPQLPPEQNGASFCYVWDYDIWTYADGQATVFPSTPDGNNSFRLYSGHLLNGGYYAGDPGYWACAYLLDENGFYSNSPVTTAQAIYDWVNNQDASTYYIDGAAVSQEQFNQWKARWDSDSFLISLSHGSDPSADVRGLGPAEDMLAFLDAVAGGEQTQTGPADAAAADAAQPANTPSYEDPSVLAYHTDSRLDQAAHIRHTDLDPQGYDLEVYYEIPVFAENTSGYQKINQFFQNLEDEFFSSNNADLVAIWNSVTSPEAMYTPYTCGWSARVTTKTDQLVCVRLFYSWYAGGVTNYGDKNYVFDPVTGNQLNLSDLTGITEGELQQIVIDQLIAEYGSPEAFYLDTIRNYSLDRFDFYIADGAPYVHFDKYEIAPGAAGEFDLKLPLTLNRH